MQVTKTKETQGKGQKKGSIKGKNK